MGRFYNSEIKNMIRLILKEIDVSNFDVKLLSRKEFTGRLKIVEDWLDLQEMPIDLKKLHFRDVIKKSKKVNLFLFKLKLNALSYLMVVFMVLSLFIGNLGKYSTLSTFHENRSEYGLLDSISKYGMILLVVIFIIFVIEYRVTMKNKNKTISFKSYYQYLRSIESYMTTGFPKSSNYVIPKHKK